MGAWTPKLNRKVAPRRRQPPGLSPDTTDREDNMSSIPQWVGTFHFGDQEHTLTYPAADEAAALEMIEGPDDALRPAIEAVMSRAGRDPRMAWHDYEGLGVELADSSEAS